MVRFSLPWWVKGEWGERVLTVVDLIRYMGEVDVSVKPKRMRGSYVWTPSMSGSIKVNVDDFFRVDLDNGGIKRVFRDSRGNILIQYGKKVNAKSAALAELVAIWEGFLVVAASH